MSARRASRIVRPASSAISAPSRTRPRVSATRLPPKPWPQENSSASLARGGFRAAARQRRQGQRLGRRLDAGLTSRAPLAPDRADLAVQRAAGLDRQLAILDAPIDAAGGANG